MFVVTTNRKSLLYGLVLPGTYEQKVYEPTGSFFVCDTSFQNEHFDVSSSHQMDSESRRNQKTIFGYNIYFLIGTKRPDWHFDSLRRTKKTKMLSLMFYHPLKTFIPHIYFLINIGTKIFQYVLTEALIAAEVIPFVEVTRLPQFTANEWRLKMESTLISV